MSLGTTAPVWSIVTDSRGRRLGMVSTPLDGADVGPPRPERVVGEQGRVILGFAWSGHREDTRKSPDGDRHCRQLYALNRGCDVVAEELAAGRGDVPITVAGITVSTPVQDGRSHHSQVPRSILRRRPARAVGRDVSASTVLREMLSRRLDTRSDDVQRVVAGDPISPNGWTRRLRERGPTELPFATPGTPKARLHTMCDRAHRLTKVSVLRRGAMPRSRNASPGRCGPRRRTTTLMLGPAAER